MRFLSLGLILLIAIFTACVAVNEPEPAMEDNPAGSGALDVATVQPRQTATPTPLPPPTTLTTTPWPPDPMPSPTPVPPFPGMFYRNSEGLWFVDNQWQPQFLMGGLHVSPGPGNNLLSEEADDIWLWDVSSQELTNLTNTPDQSECCAARWPGNPTKITFLRNPNVGSGTPVLYDLVSGEETALIQNPEEQTMSDMMGSPNGRTLAYELNGTDLWLYDDQAGETAVALNPADFGFPADVQIARLGAPSWSADSQSIAVIMAIQTPEKPWQIALAVFDLTNQTSHLYHPYENVGRGGWFPPAPWSPNGEWIAFVTEDADPNQRGLWLINQFNDDEKFIPEAFNPFWSPDGQYLIYQTAEGTFLTYPPEFSYQISVYLPEGGTVIEWEARP